jgi:hypothetical protein
MMQQRKWIGFWVRCCGYHATGTGIQYVISMNKA